MISVVHNENNGKTYANISAVMPVPSNIKKAGLPEAHNEVRMFSISEPDMELFEELSPFVQEKIQKSPEWKARQPQAAPSGFEDMKDDEIPFK